MVKNQQLFVNRNGYQSSDFMLIKNAVQANHLAALTNEKSAFGDVFNVTSGESCTLNNLIKLLSESLIYQKFNLKNKNVNFVSERIGDVKHSEASLEKISSVLGYYKEYSIKKGIEEYVIWYINNEEN